MLREARKLSQGDIEKRSGLLCPYLSRIEDGHTVPSVETSEKLARLEVPIFQLFREGKGRPKLTPLRGHKTAEEIGWGVSSKHSRSLPKFRRLRARMKESDWRLLLPMGQQMAKR